MEIKRRRYTWPRIFLAGIMVFVLFQIWKIPFTVGQFYETLDDFSGNISRQEQLPSRENLKNLEYFYDLNNDLPFGMDSFANKYLFKDSLPYESAFDYIQGRYDRVIEKLENEDGYWAFFLKANSRWRIAQAEFRHALTLTDPKELAEQKQKADSKAESTKAEYEKAIKSDNPSNPKLAPRYNYDLVTDQSARQAALGPRPIKVKVMLGEGGRNKKGSGDEKGQGPTGKGSEDLDNMGPPKDSRSRPGTRRPG